MASLPLGIQAALDHDWRLWARPQQLAPPGDWRIWLYLGGRGAGKSRSGAEWLLEEVQSGRRHRIALVGATAGDVRDVMIEGDSGLLTVAKPWFKPVYNPSLRRLRFPNGAWAVVFTSEEPERLRGPQHDAAWCDELAAWTYGQETWDNLMLGLRRGRDPRAVVTTTPRPIPIIKALLKDPTCTVTRGTTYENARNLAPAFLDKIISRYAGTRLGRQELNAEVLDDVPGALWTREIMERNRVRERPDRFSRIVVAIDPAVSHGEDAADTGIIVAGKDYQDHGYVLSDVSVNATPEKWARLAVDAYHLWRADLIVAEVNQGGEMVTHTIHTIDHGVPVRVVHASRGKRVRAEPVSSLYEQGRVHHVGAFPMLEDQLCTWVPDDDDDMLKDRLDACVWAFTDLLVDGPNHATGGPFAIGTQPGWRV